MACGFDRALLGALVDGELDARAKGVAESHVAACAECREELSAARLVSSNLRHLPSPKAPPSVLEAVRREFAKTPRRQAFPPRRFPLVIAAALSAAASLLLAFLVAVHRPRESSELAARQPAAQPIAQAEQAQDQLRFQDGLQAQRGLQAGAAAQQQVEPATIVLIAYSDKPDETRDAIRRALTPWASGGEFQDSFYAAQADAPAAREALLALASQKDFRIEELSPIERQNWARVEGEYGTLEVTGRGAAAKGAPNALEKSEAFEAKKASELRSLDEGAAVPQLARKEVQTYRARAKSADAAKAPAPLAAENQLEDRKPKQDKLPPAPGGAGQGRPAALRGEPADVVRKDAAQASEPEALRPPTTPARRPVEEASKQRGFTGGFGSAERALSKGSGPEDKPSASARARDSKELAAPVLIRVFIVPASSARRLREELKRIPQAGK